MQVRKRQLWLRDWLSLRSSECCIRIFVEEQRTYDIPNEPGFISLHMTPFHDVQVRRTFTRPYVCSERMHCRVCTGIQCMAFMYDVHTRPCEHRLKYIALPLLMWLCKLRKFLFNGSKFNSRFVWNFISLSSTRNSSLPFKIATSELIVCFRFFTSGEKRGYSAEVVC